MKTSTMENLQIAMLDRTAQRRQAREIEEHEFLEPGTQPGPVPDKVEYTGSPLIGLVFLLAMAFWSGAALGMMFTWLRSLFF